MPKKTFAAAAKGKCDLIVGLKNNQPKLAACAADAFAESGQRASAFVTLDKERGQPVTRSYRAVPAAAPLRRRRGCREWTSWLKTFVSVERTSGETTERRLYACTRKIDAREAERLVRGHWDVENRFHLTLDRCLGEDASRKSGFARVRTLLNAFAHNLLRRNAAAGGWRIEMMLNNRSLDRLFDYKGLF